VSETLTAEEREDLQSTARRYLRGIADADRQIDWAEVIELGWASIGVPEEMGGAGYGDRERALISEAAGESLQGGALWPTLGVGLPLMMALGSTDLVASIAGGSRIAVGWSGEATSAFSDAFSSPQVHYRDGQVTGTVHAVAGADVAEALILPVADVSGEPAIVLVGRDALVIHETPRRYVDESCRVSVVDIDGGADCLAGGVPARQVWDRARLSAVVWLAAESVGLASFLLDLAVRHASEREQFGRAIGSFQAVSHQLADLYGDIELARSAVGWAAESIDLDHSDAEAATLSASLLADTAAVSAGEKAIQVLGGLGMTWESPVHRYFKRAMANEAFDGNARGRRRRLADLLFDGAAVSP
jgi:alkylation response protein AidB-like acyl-CoA dehydrogenase